MVLTVPTQETGRSSSTELPALGYAAALARAQQPAAGARSHTPMIRRRAGRLAAVAASRPSGAGLHVRCLSNASANDPGLGNAVPLEDNTSTSFGNNLRGLGHNNYLGKILNARVYEVANETPLQPAPRLSAHLQNTVLIKREDLQPVFSFKIRGAYNKIAHLSREQLKAGVVACSAGNHAQGVALSASHVGTDAVIVMPSGTPSIKVDAVRKFGGTVRLHGTSYDEAQAEAMRLVEVEGRTLIHPFDDPLVIAGQGTIGAEILKQTTGQPLHAVFVCCGGGGMLAGIATYMKRVRPGVMVIGVEAEDAAGMTASLRAGARITLDQVGLFADGAGTRRRVGSGATARCPRRALLGGAHDAYDAHGRSLATTPWPLPRAVPAARPPTPRCGAT